MAPASDPQRPRRKPLYDIDPATGVSIEVFYADRTLETFGRGGAGWFWWPRRRGCSPVGSPAGPFATSYAAYRHAMSAMAAMHGAAFADPQRQYGHSADTEFYNRERFRLNA
jgi:hypothetical protein